MIDQHDVDGMEELRSFVSGKLSPSDFENLLYQSKSLENFLSTISPPLFFKGGTTLYQFLIGLDYSNPSHIADAQSSVHALLSEEGDELALDTTHSELYKAVLSAEPKWLSIPTDFVPTLFEGSTNVDKSNFPVWLKSRIAELFRYQSKPPKWIQGSMWPIEKQKPLIFIGQMDLKDLMHDESHVYIFFNPATNECKTIIQSA